MAAGQFMAHNAASYAMTTLALMPLFGRPTSGQDRWPVARGDRVRLHMTVAGGLISMAMPVERWKTAELR
jgi:hypothetical protein